MIRNYFYFYAEQKNFVCFNLITNSRCILVCVEYKKHGIQGGNLNVNQLLFKSAVSALGSTIFYFK